MLPLLRKDVKTLHWKRSLTMQVLMLGMFFIFTISQLGELEANLGLSIEGMVPLLHKLNETREHRLMFTNSLMTVGFLSSALVFALYVGIPHILQFFTKEKAEKNLGFMLAVWLFALIRVVVMSMINGILIWCIFTVLGFRSVGSVSLFSSALTILLGIAAFLYLANAIVWATHGSELILKVYRILILVGIVAAFPAVNVLRMDFSGLDFRYVGLSLGIFVMAILFSKLIMGYFKVEKVV
ncbi:hypothetical protein Q9R46_08035 [Paenibacillus sp. RRE4]|uniref:hypothetical protein n=1 Tax=Paenibacillus sp. RRE4 TaxID=2962587 RepID=UPI002880E2C7|nr:hypothetical protein [Paenibacillus sp. RRE4]MDT0122585.1 hypothetical protein [Paenibacillus sp. RRE4]